MKWIEGRQGTKYFKCKLLVSERFKFDIYLLKYPTGSYIDPHTDPIENGEHHRVNVVLNRGYFDGGVFERYYEHKTVFDVHRVNYFRPDLVTHGVTRVTKGTRYTLSIGWIRGKK